MTTSPPSCSSATPPDSVVILLSGARVLAAARRVAMLLVSVMREPFVLGADRVDVGISIGIAVMPDQGREATGIIE